MRSYIPLILCGALAAGCSTSAELGNPFGGSEQNAQLAAYAASSHYPNQQPTGTMAIAALVDRDRNDVELINTTDKPISNAKVWVNGSYVTPLGTLPAHGVVKLSRNVFYDSTGRSLGKSNTLITRVDLQT